jgi:hypothetical protein
VISAIVCLDDHLLLLDQAVNRLDVVRRDLLELSHPISQHIDPVAIDRPHCRNRQYRPPDRFHSFPHSFSCPMKVSHSALARASGGML